MSASSQIGYVKLVEYLCENKYNTRKSIKKGRDVMKIKNIRLMLCIVFLMFILSFADNVYAQEILENSEIASGTCGESITWSLDENGTLTFRGIGEMPDYS